MENKDIFVGQLATPRMSTAPTAIMTDEIRWQMVEKLINGEQPDTVVRWLSIKGFAPQVVREEIDRATKDPFYQGTMRMRTRLMKRDWQLAIYRKLAELAPDAGEVAVETGITPEDFLTRYYAGHRPVLLRGMIDHWPAMGKWTLDYFEELFGEQDISVQWGREGNPEYERYKDAHRRVIPFADVAARLRTGEPSNDYYVTASNEENLDLLEPLWDDMGDLPGILEARDGNRGFFWLGPAGTITPFHHDLTNNLLVQIRGRKRVKLVAAHDTGLMRNDRHCFSQWTGDDLPAGEARKNKPRVMEVVLDEGEALFLPVGWWHHVEALDMTIGASFTNFVWPNDHTSDYTAFGEQ
ncbi:MAG: cupin-like domain-containing protein [Pseudomonadota bacterium]